MRWAARAHGPCLSAGVDRALLHFTVMLATRWRHCHILQLRYFPTVCIAMCSRKRDSKHDRSAFWAQTIKTCNDTIILPGECYVVPRVLRPLVYFHSRTAMLFKRTILTALHDRCQIQGHVLRWCRPFWRAQHATVCHLDCCMVLRKHFAPQNAR